MIQNISFTSVYRFRCRNKNGHCHQSQLPAQVADANLSHLKDGDCVTITKMPYSNRHELTVPDYMDENVERYCMHRGIEFKKSRNCD